MRKRCLLLRADSGPGLGVGHLARCLTLGQAWQADGGEAVLITASPASGVLEWVSATGISVVRLARSYPDGEDLAVTAEQLRKDPEAWLVADGYAFDAAYQRAIKDLAARLLVIDDLGQAARYCADIVLNQNVEPGRLQYPCEPSTRLLLGPRYALLNPAYQPWREKPRETPQTARNVLVTFGGSDQHNITARMLAGFDALGECNLEVVVVLGPAYAHPLPAHPDSRIRFVRSPDPGSLARWMAWADLAVTAGGSTCWELAFMGVPSLIVLTADNQRVVADTIRRHVAGHVLGWWSEVHPADLAKALVGLLQDERGRRQMAAAGPQLVDGYGVERVLAAMKEAA